MTDDHHYNLARNIEELRLEAREAPTAKERREIEAQVEALRAELAEHATEQELP
ncbi:hypothetical protein LVY75_00515 (plasmid) [Sinorhizobium sp. B11]